MSFHYIKRNTFPTELGKQRPQYSDIFAVRFRKSFSLQISSLNQRQVYILLEEYSDIEEGEFVLSSCLFGGSVPKVEAGLYSFGGGYLR